MTQTVERRTRLPARRRVEAPLTLTEPPPRVLGWVDQLGLWGNLGISLLGPVGAVFVLYPTATAVLSLAAALTAVIVGTLVGSVVLGIAAIPGARTGSPAMVLLRGSFGRAGSYLPTALNVVQLVGWTVFEIVVISQAAAQLLPWHDRTPYIIGAGLLTTVMAAHPLGAVRVLRRYAIAATAIATTYLFIELLRHHLTSPPHGGWGGFWLAVDYGVALAVSWVPLASDYSRHSRTERAAFGGAAVGYGVTQVACLALGLVALLTVVRASADQDLLAHDVFAAFLAVPIGWLAFAVLVLRELDQSFADTYSTVVSMQNVAPRISRVRLALVLGPVATMLALVLHIKDYQSFLLLIGSVFVPMFGVFAVDFFLIARGRAWDVSDHAPVRWPLFLPWFAGFVVYQLVNPGYVSWWARMWQHAQRGLSFAPASWMSASLLSLTVAAVLTVLVAPLRRRTPR